MKDQEMIQSPKFEVDLGGIDLTKPQAQELEKAIQQTTLQFLANLDNEFVKDVFELIPNPGQPGNPNPQPNLLFDRKWWLGQKLLRLRDNQRIGAEVFGAIAGPDISQTFLLRQLK